MANFPTSLPSITNPTANDTLAAVPHHTQHGTANDEIAAIAAKIGIASTPVVNAALLGTENRVHHRAAVHRRQRGPRHHRRRFPGLDRYAQPGGSAARIWINSVMREG